MNSGVNGKYLLPYKARSHVGWSHQPKVVLPGLAWLGLIKLEPISKIRSDQEGKKVFRSLAHLATGNGFTDDNDAACELEALLDLGVSREAGTASAFEVASTDCGTQDKPISV